LRGILAVSVSVTVLEVKESAVVILIVSLLTKDLKLETASVRLVSQVLHVTSVPLATETIHIVSLVHAAWQGQREVNAVGTVSAKDMQPDEGVIDVKPDSLLLFQQILMVVLNVSVMG
jgi:hypothetical protein